MRPTYRAFLRRTPDAEWEEMTDVSFQFRQFEWSYDRSCIVAFNYWKDRALRGEFLAPRASLVVLPVPQVPVGPNVRRKS